MARTVGSSTLTLRTIPPGLLIRSALQFVRLNYKETKERKKRRSVWKKGRGSDHEVGSGSDLLMARKNK